MCYLSLHINSPVKVCSATPITNKPSVFPLHNLLNGIIYIWKFLKGDYTFSVALKKCCMGLWAHLLVLGLPLAVQHALLIYRFHLYAQPIRLIVI